MAAALAVLLLSSGHIATPDGHLRLAQAFELIDHGTFRLPEDVGNPSHGNIVTQPGGARYSVYNPGHVLLLSIPALIARALSDLAGLHDHYVAAFLASFLGPIAHFLCAFVLASTCRAAGASARAACSAAVVYAVATVALPHARDGYEHVFEALALISGFRFAIASNARSDAAALRMAALAGLCLGCGLLFRNTAVLAIPGLLIVLRRIRPAAAFLAVFGLFGAITAAYNAARFGSPLETGYTDAWRDTGIDGGFFSTPLLVGLYGLWLSSGKGLLLYAPALVLALAGLPRLVSRQRRVAAGVLTVVGAYSVFYATNFAWHGSPWCWGPRYLVPVVPLLMIAFPDYGASGGRLTRMVGVLVVAVSAAIQAAAISVDYRRHLVEVYVARPTAFDDGRILFDPTLSPVAGQAASAWHVLVLDPADRSFELYLPDHRWLDERRPASHAMMLRDSVDLNAPDYWWARWVWASASPAGREAARMLAILLALGVLAAPVATVARRSE